MMHFRPAWREVAPHVAVMAVLLTAGSVLVWLAHQGLGNKARALAAAQSELREGSERLRRVAQEVREARDYIDLYQRLKDLRILGEERRLEWVEALARIRAARELAEVRYQVEPQKTLKAFPGKPGLELRSSSMKVELGLLHEGDLLGFLEDLRASGNAYYSVRQCTITRSVETPPATPIAPRLRAHCQIDLITLAGTKGGA